jgi:crotonobetainyl-CoA:carnitine CoA-transferase CaiB-like acyl-CoA transferase
MRAFIQEVERWFAARTYEEAAKALEEHQVPYSPIMSMADIFAEPHYRERDMIIDVPEPTLGSLPQPGVVPKLSRTPGRVTHAGPPLGQDNEEILRQFLQMSPAEIAELRREGVI